jgi:hypothetical protein
MSSSLTLAMTKSSTYRHTLTKIASEAYTREGGEDLVAPEFGRLHTAIEGFLQFDINTAILIQLVIFWYAVPTSAPTFLLSFAPKRSTKYMEESPKAEDKVSSSSYPLLS